MTAKFVWDELKKLVIIDHEINNLKKQIKKTQADLETVRAPLAPLKARHDELSHTIRETQKKIDQLELSLAQFRETDAEKKAVLETLSQPKEYHALERELADLERQIVGLESQEIKIMEQQEEAQKELEAVAAEHEQVKQAISSQAQETQAVITDLEAQIVDHEKKWETQATHVPSDLSKGYTEIRQRVPNPVVPIVSASCSACFHGLLHQDTIALHSQTIIRCRGCYRFLFTPDSTTEQLAS
jgi:predicted  nucleic acid-binding Zn-ribbon protein